MNYTNEARYGSQNSLLNYFAILENASQYSATPLPSQLQLEKEQEESSSDSEEEIFKSHTHAVVVDSAGVWGAHRFKEKPFATRKKEVRIRNYSDLTLKGEELDGVLSQRMIACCVSNLERVPELNCYAYCKLTLEAKGLTDITAIKKYHFVQYLNLSFNKLTTLQPLGDLPFLQYLYVNHNELEDLLDFKAPFYLTHVNFSYNQVKEMRDLKDFWSLVHLDLSFNEIEVIEGLESLKFLSYLDLSHNKIKVVENISNLRIQTLLIRANMIERIQEGEGVGFHTLVYIRTINLTHNEIDTLRYFEACYNLETLIVAANKISSSMDIYYLRKLQHLRNLDIRENPVCCVAHCYSMCYRTLQHLHELNGDEVSVKKRVLSKFTQDIDYTLRARLDRMELLLLEQLNLPVIGAHVVPCDFPPPPIIVVAGPLGSRKKEVVFRFVMRNRKAVLGVSYTTRPRKSEEVEGRHYYFVEESKFDDLLKHGEFITVSESYGFRYAISFRELCKSTTENKVLVFHSDLSAALMLKLMGLCPRIVLALPMSEKTHLQWLKETYIYQFINRNLVLIKNCPACVKEVAQYVSSEECSTVSSSTLESNATSQAVSHDYLVNADEIEKQETVYMTATETFEMLQQEHLKIFLDDVMENRAEMLRLHNENTGLFRDVIFTDDVEDALRRLKALLKHTVENHFSSGIPFELEKDKSFREMISQKLKRVNLLENIYFNNS
nr:unnamed protein product [Callosobruchus chinensis]